MTWTIGAWTFGPSAVAWAVAGATCSLFLLVRARRQARRDEVQRGEWQRAGAEREAREAGAEAEAKALHLRTVLALERIATALDAPERGTRGFRLRAPPRARGERP